MMEPLVALVLLALGRFSHAASSGIASYYGGNLAGGTCLFSSYSLPSGIYGTALSGANWDSAALCGACLNVTGPKGSIEVMVRRPSPPPQGDVRGEEAVFALSF